MEIFKIVIAALGVVAVVYFLIKKYDTKLVLFTAGLGMATISLQPMKALDAFAKSMTTGSLIQAICSVLGFAAVLKLTGCDKHLVALFGGILKRAGLFLVPAAILLTFTTNVALPTAAGCAAAVGTIFIPLLINSGVRPAMAAAAVFAGTYGSMLNPGLSHNAFVAKIANVEAMDIINVHMFATIASIVVAAVVIGIIAIIKKEHKGYVSDDKDIAVEAGFKVNPIYALVNVVPLFILIVGFAGWIPVLKMDIPQAMLIGAVLAIIVTRKSPSEVCKNFFNGMGGGYADILGIIICASVFVAGLDALGAVQSFINVLTTHPSWASIGGTAGPFLLAVITGSGDAAAFAFNEAVTPSAELFNTTVEKLGALASVAGAIGRTMSPLAGAVIVCAGFAKVSTLEVAKRTAPGMILAVITLYIILG